MPAPRNAAAVGLATWLRVVAAVSLCFGLLFSANIVLSGGGSELPRGMVWQSAYVVFAEHLTVSLVLAAAALRVLSDCETHLAAIQHYGKVEFQERYPPQ